MSNIREYTIVFSEEKVAVDMSKAVTVNIGGRLFRGGRVLRSGCQGVEAK